MGLTNPLPQSFVLGRSTAPRTSLPRIKAAAAYPVKRAHHADRERRLLSFDELEDLALLCEVNSMADETRWTAVLERIERDRPADRIDDQGADFAGLMESVRRCREVPSRSPG